MTNRIDCPICGARESAELKISFANQKVDAFACEVKVYAHECMDCGCTFADDNDSRMNKREMVSLKKRAFDLLSGKRVREIRSNLGLTIESANKVFGGGPVAFSKYENDDLCQSEQMDKLLVGAERFPDFFAYLVDRSGIQLDLKAVSVNKTEEKSTVSDVFEQNATVYDPKLYRKVREGVMSAK